MITINLDFSFTILLSKITMRHELSWAKCSWFCYCTIYSPSRETKFRTEFLVATVTTSLIFYFSKKLKIGKNFEKSKFFIKILDGRPDFSKIWLIETTWINVNRIETEVQQ